MAEGNDFFRTLIWPPTERLLGPVAGKKVLDVACGNGVSSRRLAAMGARVIAFDFAERMIERAGGREKFAGLVNGCSTSGRAKTMRLGEREFDAAVCNMALFDDSWIEHAAGPDGQQAGLLADFLGAASMLQ